MMWVDQEQLWFPWNQQALFAPSVLSCISSLCLWQWVDSGWVSLIILPWGSVKCSRTPPDGPQWDLGARRGQAHLPYNAQTTVCVTQWQRAGVLSSSSPCLHVARSPAVLRGPGRDATTAVMVHRTRAGPCGQSRGRNPNVLGQHRGKTIVWNSKLSLY